MFDRKIMEHLYQLALNFRFGKWVIAKKCLKLSVE